MVHVGDTFKIEVPMEIKREVKDFTVEQIYRHFAVLTDGIIRVCYTHWELAQAKILWEKKREPIIGCWN